MTSPEATKPEDTVTAGCVSCGSPAARPIDTTDGRVSMCPPCVALHDIGCP